MLDPEAFLNPALFQQNPNNVTTDNPTVALLRPSTLNAPLLSSYDSNEGQVHTSSSNVATGVGIPMFSSDPNAQIWRVYGYQSWIPEDNELEERERELEDLRLRLEETERKVNPLVAFPSPLFLLFSLKGRFLFVCF